MFEWKAVELSFSRKFIFCKLYKRCRINCILNWSSSGFIKYACVRDFLRSVFTTIVLIYTQKIKGAVNWGVQKILIVKGDFLKTQECFWWKSLSLKRTTTLHGRKIWTLPRSTSGTIYFWKMQFPGSRDILLNMFDAFHYICLFLDLVTLR